MPDPAGFEKYSGKFLVRGGEIQALEGDWKPTRIVLVDGVTPERR